MISLPKPERRGPKSRRPIPPRRSGRRRFNPFAAHHKLEKLCDDTFALVVRLRAGNRCKLCGSDYMTQCAHLVSRRYKSLRHSFDNAWCLCLSCHKRWTEDPLGWDDLVERAVGIVEWQRRKFEARVPCRPDYSLMRTPLRLLLVGQAINGAFGLDGQIERILSRHTPYDQP